MSADGDFTPQDNHLTAGTLPILQKKKLRLHYTILPTQSSFSPLHPGCLLPSTDRCLVSSKAREKESTEGQGDFLTQVKLFFGDPRNGKEESSAGAPCMEVNGGSSG